MGGKSEQFLASMDMVSYLLPIHFMALNATDKEIIEEAGRGMGLF